MEIKKYNYIGTYAYDDCVINVLIKANNEFDAKVGFRTFMDKQLDNGLERYAQIRVRPLNFIQQIEV